jgi:hypothetical protein
MDFNIYVPLSTLSDCFLVMLCLTQPAHVDSWLAQCLRQGTRIWPTRLQITDASALGMFTLETKMSSSSESVNKANSSEIYTSISTHYMRFALLPSDHRFLSTISIHFNALFTISSRAANSSPSCTYNGDIRQWAHQGRLQQHSPSSPAN